MERIRSREGRKISGNGGINKRNVQKSLNWLGAPVYNAPIFSGAKIATNVLEGSVVF